MDKPCIQHPLAMTPNGSLNKLSVNSLLLDARDPLINRTGLTGSGLMSRQALIGLLHHQNHPLASDLRLFLSCFDPDVTRDHTILQLYARRFSAVINTARSPGAWIGSTAFEVALQHHWQSMTTLVLAGGLTSAQFGVSLAQQVEQFCGDLAVISSPWGSSTALYGLAQTVAHPQDILVMDFGATGIKRAIAHRYGNHLSLLPELEVSDYTSDGMVRRDGMIRALKDTRTALDQPLATAISIACYLQNGHPFRYFSGIYHRLIDDCQHLATELNNRWLPEAGLGTLLLLEHDSTAAALAFRFREPAMMVTLGTGLGSAACPRVDET